MYSTFYPFRVAFNVAKCSQDITIFSMVEKGTAFLEKAPTLGKCSTVDFPDQQ